MATLQTPTLTPTRGRADIATGVRAGAPGLGSDTGRSFLRAGPPDSMR
jgi:hypothetical protein